MKPARLLLLIVAIVAGGLAAFLATRGNAPVQEAKVEIKQEARTQILVASRPIGIGDRLTATSIEWQDWPEGAVRPEYVTILTSPDAPEQLAGAIARFEIFDGEPIREAKLARSGQGYLSAVLEQGMRGVSIGVSAVSGAGGFIVPNDRVDVVLTRSTSLGKQSETILANVKVLAIGRRLGEPTPSAAPEGEEENVQAGKTFKKSTIATLELDPLQAETVINGSEIGDLALILRSITDFAPDSDDGLQRNSASIRMIRFGKEKNIISGNVQTNADMPQQSSAASGASANASPAQNQSTVPSTASAPPPPPNLGPQIAN